MPVLTRRRRTLLVLLATAAVVSAANMAQGAYFSQSWGWVALAFLVPTTLVLLLGVVDAPGRGRVAFAALVAAFAAWTTLSALWSVSPSGTLRETERMLVYVALALAVAFLLRRGDAGAVAGGVLLGIVVVSAYALGSKLLPELYAPYDLEREGYQLQRPVGYKNALGLLTAIGALLALGVAAHARSLLLRMLGAAAVPGLAVTLYFTFSRGAIAALAVGLAAAVAVDARRFRLLATTVLVGAVSAAVVAAASRQDALTREDALAADIEEQGRRLLAVLGLFAALSALCALALGLAERRVSAPRGLRRAVDAALALAVVAAIALGLVAVGGPRAAVRELEGRFEARYLPNDPDLNTRYFSLSGHKRSEPLGVAWELGQERPALGYGGGAFEYLWYERRPSDYVIRDAHSLYLETLAELGVVGLALLGLALAVPLAAAAAGRRSRLVPVATGAYLAWASHAALDWDWEVVGLTSAALLAGAVPLLAAERGPRRPLSERARLPLVWVGVPLSLAAVVSLVGNQALFAGRAALLRNEPTSALEHARRADALLPWSHEPAIVRGDALARLGDRPGALAAYRDAVSADDRNWVAWLRLAQLERGSERADAYRRVRALNPLEEELPGEPAERS